LFGKKAKGVNWILKTAFNVAYHIMEAKLYHKNGKWFGGQKNRLERKKKGLVRFLKTVFNVAYHIVETKWFGGQNA